MLQPLVRRKKTYTKALLFNQFSLIQNYLTNLRYNYDIQTHTKMCGFQAKKPRKLHVTGMPLY